jgi:AraC family transcriptional regulator of adaptative response/methylated-DNA-[protein]-cysteine methyltransferase
LGEGPEPTAKFADGPLRFRRREALVFGTGKSSLGRVLVASGAKGIVAILLGQSDQALLRDLGARFPKSDLFRDRKAQAVVARVLKFIEAPVGAFKLPLDIRGTDFQKRVWEEVRQIPAGGTSTYSRIAAAIGAPKAVRAVASTCAANGFAFAVPCHRVVHKDSATRGRRAGRHYRFLEYEAKVLARRRT